MAKGDIILGSGGKICLYNGKIVIDDGVRIGKGVYVNGKRYDEYPSLDCYIDTVISITYEITRHWDDPDPEVEPETEIVEGPSTSYSTRPYSNMFGETYYKIDGVYTPSANDVMRGISNLEIVGMSYASHSGIIPVVKYNSTLVDYSGSQYDEATDTLTTTYTKITAEVVWPIRFYKGTSWPWGYTYDERSPTRAAYYCVAETGSFKQFDGTLEYKEGTNDLTMSPTIEEFLPHRYEKMAGLFIPHIGTRSAWFKKDNVYPTIPCPRNLRDRFISPENAVIKGTISYPGLTVR